MKTKTLYQCSNCQYQSPKWAGHCPACDSWNTFVEATITPLHKNSLQSHRSLGQAQTAQPLHHFIEEKETKIHTGIKELDRTIGDGFTLYSATLLGGEPGIGKSTLTLQLADRLSTLGLKLLYVSGEEAANQIAARAKRLSLNTEKIHFLQENNLENVLATVEQDKPQFLIIDSIQTIYSYDLTGIPGSISQTVLVTERLIEYCKKNRVTLLLIGHVTKEGTLAGPKILEHLVDTVLTLEGDRYSQNRILRTVKNRFGSTNELGIFQMDEKGLQEVNNPSLYVLEGRQANAIGSSLTMTVEGNRPLLMEFQALTATTHFGYPKRTTQGFDMNRLHILIAVLEKYGKLKLSEQDVFINIVGGFKIQDPACDLAIMAAIYSSYFKKGIPAQQAFLGEIGLSGEIRPVTNLDSRLQELSKIGITEIFLPKATTNKKHPKLNLNFINNIDEFIKI